MKHDQHYETTSNAFQYHIDNIVAPKLRGKKENILSTKSISRVIP